MARPVVVESLSVNQVVEIVLPDADSTVLVVSHPGLGMSGVGDGPPTKNYVDVGGLASFAMRYGSDGTRTWAPTVSVGWTDPEQIANIPASEFPAMNSDNENQSLDTGLLWDWVGHKCKFRRYPEGKISGKESRIGDFWLVVAKGRNGNKMMLEISGRSASDLEIGTVA